MFVNPLFKKATILGSTIIGNHLLKRLKQYDIEINAPSRIEATSLHNKDLGSVFYCIGKTANFLVNPVETINAHVNILSNILEYSNYESLIYLSSTRLNDSYFTENDQVPKR